MKNTLFILIFLISSFYVSAQDNTDKIKITYGAENEEIPNLNDTITEYHKGLNIIKKLKFRNDKELTMIEFDKSGTKFKKSVFPLSNLKYKTVTKYHRNGNAILIATYDNGIVNGYFKKFYDNGNLKSEGVYLKMKKDGIWKYYDQHGNFLKEELYQNGVLKE